MSSTSNLGLPHMMPAQAQKHLTVNEALTRLDAVVQLSVKGHLNAPDPTAQVGERYLVSNTPETEWDGKSGWVAMVVEGGWEMIEPKEGWLCYDTSTEVLSVLSQAGWRSVGLAETVRIANALGIAVDAAGTDRLAVRGLSSLFDGGDGGHQLKVNRAGTADTASLLFQTGFSGNAEVGVQGNGDFVIKTSADGAQWQSAMSVPAEGTGVIFSDVPKVGAASLLTEESVTSPMQYEDRIPDEADLDAYDRTGYLYQSHSTRAANGTNYPVAQPGILIVHAAGGFISQTYRVYSSAPGEFADATFTRGRTGSVWSSWKRLDG